VSLLAGLLTPETNNGGAITTFRGRLKSMWKAQKNTNSWFLVKKKSYILLKKFNITIKNLTTLQSTKLR